MRTLRATALTVYGLLWCLPWSHVLIGTIRHATRLMLIAGFCSQDLADVARVAIKARRIA